jgi:hypothetical protein
VTYSPTDLLTVRSYLLRELDLQPGVARDADLEPGEVGIVGDAAHLASGGYHVGNDDLARAGLLYSDYSKRESPRDRPGTNAASALDIGDFDATVHGRRNTLRSLSTAIVEASKRGDPRTRDIREVIYTPDGVTVRRWDRLGLRSDGDSSHLWHTHLSFFRDSEGRRAQDDNLLGLLKEIIEGDDMPLTADQEQTLRDTYYWARAACTGRDTAGNVVRDPWDGAPVLGVRQLGVIAADVAAVRAADSAQTAAITALVDTINKMAAGTGGRLDAAPILAAIDDVKTSVHAEVRAQFARLARAGKPEAWSGALSAE